MPKACPLSNTRQPAAPEMGGVFHVPKAATFSNQSNTWSRSDVSLSPAILVFCHDAP